MRCGSFTANGEIFCVPQHSCCCCCNTPKNLIQHAQSFPVFRTRTHKKEKKRSCAVITSLQKKNYIYKKNNNSCNPKELLIYFPCLKMPLSIIQQNLQIYTDWIQQRSAKSLVCSFFPSSPFRKRINNQQSDQSDFFFHNL